MPDEEEDEETIEERKASAALIAAAPEMYEALKEIDNNDGESCQRCEGNGRLWADGQAHLPSHQGLTLPCPQCNGKGRTFLDAKEIARASLAKAAPHD